MKISKLIINAEECQGNVISNFKGTEYYGKYYGGDCNISSSKQCIAVDSGGISGKFSLPLVPECCECVFRFRGMWDMYKYIPYSLESATRYVNTIGHFEVIINGFRVFNDCIVYLNYRRWRFWPAVNLRFPASLLQAGENSFVIINHTSHFKVIKIADELPDDYFNNTLYQISDIQILFIEPNQVASAETLPADTFLGHMIGHGNAVLQKNGNMSQEIKHFLHDRQGNLVVFLMNPGKFNYDLDLDLINCEDIIHAGLHVALRYYGKNKNATIEEVEYIRKLRSFALRLGDNFLGFAPHEQHGFMRKIIMENADANDISIYSREYVNLFKQTVDNIKAIRDDASVWDTDPSFYSRYHMIGGASFPAVELCVNNVSMDIASARGTAKAFGCEKWAAINSFECQAYGGLTMKDAEAQSDPEFESKRANLWWLTQHQLYLGGARIIYSESGMFEHCVSIQKEFDDPHLEDLRKIQAELNDFTKTHHLSGQPITDIAYLQGKYDIYKGDRFEQMAVSSSGNAVLSWRMLKVCYPDVPFLEWTGDACQDESKDKIQMISDTPFGEVDILPIEASEDKMSVYKLLIVSGWNTMEQDCFEKIIKYVANGGQVALLLPQLTSSKNISSPCNHINGDNLSRLCGVLIGDGNDIKSSGFKLSPAEPRDYPRLEYLLKNDSIPKSTGTLKPLEIIASTVSVILENEASKTPFLIKNKIGKGSVFLFNISAFPESCDIYDIINHALQDIASGLDMPVRLKQGRHLNFYHYAPGDGQSAHRLFVVDNDWTSSHESSEAIFSVLGRDIKVYLQKNKVSVTTFTKN